MELKQVKRLAARVTGAGEKRIRIRDPEKAQQAMTGDDIRALIKQGAIEVIQKKGVSRARANKIRAQKKKGLRKGRGKRKGGTKSRTPKKEKWMKRVRALRRKLRGEKKNLTPNAYQRLYRMIKGGFFRDKGHLELYLKERGIKK